MMLHLYSFISCTQVLILQTSQSVWKVGCPWAEKIKRTIYSQIHASNLTYLFPFFAGVEDFGRGVCSVASATPWKPNPMVNFSKNFLRGPARFYKKGLRNITCIRETLYLLLWLTKKKQCLITGAAGVKLTLFLTLKRFPAAHVV